MGRLTSVEPPDLPIRRIGGASLNGISNGERKRVSFLTALVGRRLGVLMEDQ